MITASGAVLADSRNANGILVTPKSKPTERFRLGENLLMLSRSKGSFFFESGTSLGFKDTVLRIYIIIIYSVDKMKEKKLTSFGYFGKDS